MVLRQRTGFVEQMVGEFARRPEFMLVMAPEGTRKPVKEWKGGFIKIAVQAGVPIVPAYVHYPERIIGFMPAYHPTGDYATDMAAIRAMYRPWQGKHRGTE